MKDLNVLILAAGKGTRMVSDQAKVLHQVCGKPMIQLVYRAAAELGPDRTLIVIGQDAENVRSTMTDYPSEFVLQEEQFGTGHAVMSARSQLEQMRGDLLVLVGDAPRIQPQSLEKLVHFHRDRGGVTTILTAHASDPFGYGRIMRGSQGEIQAVVEEKDATPEIRTIQEINPGFYCFQIRALLDGLVELSNDNAQNEYYLTDLIGIHNKQGLKVEGTLHDDFDELQGINTRRQLADAARALRIRKNNQLMEGGVTLIDPDRTYVDLDVEIGKDVILYPMVTIEGTTRIGAGTVVRSGTRISSSLIGSNVKILDSCLVTDSEIGAGASVGPSARLRNHTSVGEGCRIGNFVELKKSTLAAGTKAAHLTYLGDAKIGEDVNIGAGTITCNYDGSKKSETIIEDGVFIGSDSQLVAPVHIGRGAYVAAGSTITRDVPAGSLAIARGRQEVKENWARDRKRKR